MKLEVVKSCVPTDSETCLINKFIKSIYDDFFHATELENITLVFKFLSVCTLTTKVTDSSKQFQCSNILFCNKTKPL